LRNILITGGNGQVAAALKKQSIKANVSPVFCSRSELDITSAESVSTAINRIQPSIVINTAAYTAVDKAESDRDAALRTNQLGAKNIAAICHKHNIPLIHLSTDYVFDGTANKAYTENDAENPENYYGKTKWLGEREIREHCEKHIILRVSGIFSEFGHNFLKTILRLAETKSELRIVADQLTCPTYAGDIADAIYTIAANPSHAGTYHFCSEPPVTWHEFTKHIINQASLYKKLMVNNIAAITTTEYPTPAKRPAFSVLDCTKIKKDYAILQPDWKNALRLIIPALVQHN
jgi:dTDP-4-dehydrorhamnose reductase